MDTEIFKQIGFSDLQAKIYLYLIKHGQSTPTEIANSINEKRTTVYSAAEKLVSLGVINQKDKGKITAFTPKHPAALESLAEKRLRIVSRQAKSLESSLPSLINYYNEHQHEPGVATFYGSEGIQVIWNKVIATKEQYYFIRSRHDVITSKESLEEFKKARIAAGIQSENITPSEYATSPKEEASKWLLKRTFLPPSEYDSPVEIDIFGDNVAFVNYAKNGMSTLIESPEIADAMRQFFKFAQKHIRLSTSQTELSES